MIDGKRVHWEGHYLVDDRRFCLHGVYVEYRCDECDAETWLQEWGQNRRVEV